VGSKKKIKMSFRCWNKWVGFKELMRWYVTFQGFIAKGEYKEIVTGIGLPKFLGFFGTD